MPQGVMEQSVIQQIDPTVAIILAAIAGLLIGSFLNVCIYRLPRLSHRSVVTPRSRCWRCRALIAWYDNIPILSWILLRGRCRHCKRVIPVRYPLVEALTAVAFVICVAKLGISLPALKYVTYSSILITLIATDFERHILPDEFTIGGTVAGLIFSLFIPMERYFVSILLPVGLNGRVYSLSEAAFGAFVASGAIWLMATVYGKLRDVDALGFGDVKMIAMIGAFVGLRGALETMILGSVVGAIVGLAYIRLARKNWRTYHIPFGSFLGLAALFLALYGDVIQGR
jgi:leader peptidase (prepilin peptidase) / N-methyltransferase